MKQDITQQLLKRKIHIATIQETHIPYNSSQKINEYRIINSAAIPNPKKTPEHDIPGKYIAGVAIAIHQEMERQISSIGRIDHRILKIALDHQKTQTPVTILKTYAPHSGYKPAEKTAHWEKVQKH